MSVYDFSITGDKDHILDKVIDLVMSLDNKKVKGWYVAKDDNGERVIVFTWTADCKGINKFPIDMQAQELKPFVKRWLVEQVDEYSRLEKEFCQFDGSSEQGWKIYIGNIDMTELNFYTVFIAKPQIIFYGK